MKKLLFILLVLSSCGKPDPKKSYGIEHSAPQLNYEEYKGKTISRMYYCDGCGPAGDFVIIQFTDRTEIKVYAYKYDMRIYTNNYVTSSP